MVHSQFTRRLPVRVADLAPAGPMLWLQTRGELPRLLRNPAFTGASLATPLVLFAFFGLSELVREEHGVSWMTHLIASMGAYAIVSVALFAFGNGVANTRGQHMNILMLATPLPPVTYLLAKLVTAVVFSALTLVALFSFAAAITGTYLDADIYLTLLARLLS